MGMKRRLILFAALPAATVVIVSALLIAARLKDPQPDYIGLMTAPVPNEDFYRR